MTVDQLFTTDPFALTRAPEITDSFAEHLIAKVDE